MKIEMIAKSMVMPMVVSVVVWGACVVPMALCAQDNGTDGPPKVLVVHREFTKPGKGGMLHEKAESANVQALKANHVDFHYLAMTSLSGADRTLFFAGYASFAEWEAASKRLEANPTIAAAFDRGNVADGDLLSESNQSVWWREDEMSMNPHNLVGDRMMEISQYIVKPGHAAEWDELVKLVMAGYKKGIPDASWSMFHQVFGTSGDAYLVVVPLKSLEEFDARRAHAKEFAEAMGKDGMKKLDELTAACVASSQTNLFAFSPAMSNPPANWVKSEPDYWTPKKVMPMKTKAAVKPVQ